MIELYYDECNATDFSEFATNNYKNEPCYENFVIDSVRSLGLENGFLNLFAKLDDDIQKIMDSSEAKEIGSFIGKDIEEGTEVSSKLLMLSYFHILTKVSVDTEVFFVFGDRQSLDRFVEDYKVTICQ